MRTWGFVAAEAIVAATFISVFSARRGRTGGLEQRKSIHNDVRLLEQTTREKIDLDREEAQNPTGLSEEEAATKIQAIQRGKKDRQAVKENTNLLKDKHRLRAEIESLQASINTNGSPPFSLSEVGE